MSGSSSSCATVLRTSTWWHPGSSGFTPSPHAALVHATNSSTWAVGVAAPRSPGSRVRMPRGPARGRLPPRVDLSPPPGSRIPMPTPPLPLLEVVVPQAGPPPCTVKRAAPAFVPTRMTPAQPPRQLVLPSAARAPVSRALLPSTLPQRALPPPRRRKGPHHRPDLRGLHSYRRWPRHGLGLRPTLPRRPIHRLCRRHAWPGGSHKPLCPYAQCRRSCRGHP
jgi:hypothetical protein